MIQPHCGTRTKVSTAHTDTGDVFHLVYCEQGLLLWVTFLIKQQQVKPSASGCASFQPQQHYASSCQMAAQEFFMFVCVSHLSLCALYDGLLNLDNFYPVFWICVSISVIVNSNLLSNNKWTSPASSTAWDRSVYITCWFMCWAPQLRMIINLGIDQMHFPGLLLILLLIFMVWKWFSGNIC